MAGMGDQGVSALRRVERELLLKVVNDFVGQVTRSDINCAAKWGQMEDRTAADTANRKRLADAALSERTSLPACWWIFIPQCSLTTVPSWIESTTHSLRHLTQSPDIVASHSAKRILGASILEPTSENLHQFSDRVLVGSGEQAMPYSS